MAAEYPTIDPCSYDLVVCGTGLPESLLAYAAMAAGKTVLHIDCNSFYGSSFSSLNLVDFPQFLHELSSHTSAPAVSASQQQESDLEAVGIGCCPVYADIEESGTTPPGEPPGAFLLDLAGPKLLYCAGEMVELLLRSGASHHVDFKSVDGTLFFWDGQLCSVPDSRGAIFRDQLLSLKEKNLMTRFLKLIQSHISNAQVAEDGSKEASPHASVISQEDLALPFVDFLKKQGLPAKITTIILYAIAMADCYQEDTSLTRITTKEGIEFISLYSSSIARFPNAAGPFIYPMYGLGELPQAFCRCAAVKGALYVLRMPVNAVLVDKERKFAGIRLASGQDILAPKLLMNPSYNLHHLNKSTDALDSSHMPRKVVRAVCIISKSIDLNMSNVLVIFPPKCLQVEQLAAVRVLQLSSNVAVCPPGLFVAYLSVSCTDSEKGKGCIKAAIDYLFDPHTSSSEGSREKTPNNQDSEKPTLLWSCVYVQELIQGSSGSVCSCPAPDERIDYSSAVEITKKFFEELYPGEEYFPQIPVQDLDAEDSVPSE